MASNQLAFVALGGACILAAAGGGYLASRQNAVPAPAAAVVATSSAQPSVDRPVQETEAVVADNVKAPAKAPSRRDPDPAPVERRMPSRREATSTAAAPARKATLPPPSRSPAPQPERQAPTSAAVVAAQAPPVPESAPVPKPEERVAVEPPRPPAPPEKTFEELVVSADSVLGLQTENRISSETARVEDRVEARVTRDVKVADRVAISAGSRVIGSVTQVERGGKFKERARLGVQFHTLVLADGTRLPIKTETVYRDGEAPGNSSAAKIGGGAAAGAILGAILGGAKGAAIGATAGAGGGTAMVAAGDRSSATLPAGTPMTVRVLAPVTVTIEK